MADIWIKISANIFENEKMQLINGLPKKDTIIVIWVKLLCLAGKLNTSGVLIMNNKAYTDKMLASVFNRKISDVKNALKIFEEYGMITIIDGVITIKNWGKYQSFDKLEKQNEKQRIYMREYRAKQKDIACNNESNNNCKTNSNANCKINSNNCVSEESTNSKANVSRLDKDIDKDIDNNIYIHNVCSNNINNNIPPTEDLQPLTDVADSSAGELSQTTGNVEHELTGAEYMALVSVYGKDFVDKRVARAKCCKGTFNFKTLERWCREDYEKTSKYVVYKHDPFSDA